MGSIPSELSLDVTPTYVPKTISDFLGELTAIDSVSDRLLRLDDFVQRLDDERRKIDVFKRELPLCMLLLNDAIATLKEESKQCRPRNVEPVLEEFIPLKKNCDENEKSEAKKEKDSGGDKMNWMSSVQLWNTDNLKNIDSKTDQKQNSVPRLREPFTPPVSGSSNNQPWNLSIASNPQGPSSIPSAQISQAFSKPAPDVTSQSSSMEVKPSGRTELPENLFAATYPSSVPVPGWQTGPPQGYGFNMQYNNTAMPMPTFPHSSKSTNPFDLNNELSPVQAPMFPSMASLHGALPNVAAPAGLLSTSSLGTPSTSWMPSQSSYPSAMPAQAPSFTYAVPPSAYMGQQMPPSNLPPRQQGVMGFSNEGATFGSSILNQQHQQLGGIYSGPAPQNTFSTVGGNPFG